MQVGYARISTGAQNLEGQLDALQAAGCERIFEETASGSRSDRPILSQALEFVRAGDVLITYRLDRIARSLPHLIAVMDDLNQRGVEFRSLTENLDTSSPGGRLIFHVFGAVSQFELDLIRERTRAGLNAARKRGRVGGRPRRMTDDKVRAAKKLLADGTPVKEVASSLGVSVPTLFRWCPASKR
jgi:DNA invertase Pin-like site-specific DNA recombinase